MAQKTDSLVQKLDSLNKKTDAAGKQDNNIKPQAYNNRTQITGSTYFILLGSDFKQQLTAPLHTGAKGWARFGAFAAVTGILILADEPIQKQALKLRTDNKALANISKGITNTGGIYEAISLGAIGAYGFAFNNEKVKTTTFLASQAYLTSAAMSYIFKTLSGRERPSSYSVDRIDAEPTFHGPFSNVGKDKNGKKLNSSFPSGHTTVAFSAATVYAMEYRDKPLIPIISYTAASLIGISRITENRHWFTDVFVGAALGHLSGRQVVNNYHRYAKVQREEGVKKKKVSFNFQYNNGVVLPTLTYKPDN